MNEEYYKLYKLKIICAKKLDVIRAFDLGMVEKLSKRGEKLMDYRYETKNEARDFHKQRRAFVIINRKLEFLPLGSQMSHFEFCQSKGIEKENFNKLTRGYFLNGNVVFYKDYFIYDEILIKEALDFVSQIAKELSLNEFNIYFGQLPEENFKLDYYYGKYSNGKIIKYEI